MPDFFGKLVVVITVSILLGTSEIKADTGSTGYIGSSSTVSSPSITPASSTSSTSSSSSNSTSTTNSSTQDSTSSTKSSSTTSGKSTTAKPAVAALASANAVSAASSVSVAGSDGVVSNIQSTSVQVEPSTGTAGLSIPITVPAGRAGIQPNLALAYDSSQSLLGNAGVGWTLDIGSIQISTKKGVPQYNGTDIFTMEQNGSTQDLVADPNTLGLYHMEVEGAFAKIQYFTTYWMITDKKGIKYYYGNASGTTQFDPANPSHIFRWALNRVEDLNGNYMTISYLNDQGQIYPQTISYTGNDTSSLILSTYAQVSIGYVPASSPSISYISKFLVKTAQRINKITVSVGTNVQSAYTFTYHQSANSQRDLLQSVQQTGADGTSTLPPVTFTYNEALPQWNLASGWNIPSDLALNMTYSVIGGIIGPIDSGVRFIDINGDGYPDVVRNFYGTGGFVIPYTSGPPPVTYNYAYLNSKNMGWVSTNLWNSPVLLSWVGLWGPSFSIENGGTVFADFNGDGLVDIVQAISGGYGPNPSGFYINDSTGSFSKDPNWSLPSSIEFLNSLGPAYVAGTNGYSQTGAVVGDVTGNGFPDIVQSKGSTQGVYINQYSQGSKSFTQNTSFTFPSNTAYTDFTQGADLIDLTGDGLSDILYLKGGVLKVFLNNGSGWTETGDFENIQGVGDLTDLSTQVVDVNGDGLPDLVITSNGNRSNATILLNSGSGWTKYQGNIGDFNFFDYGTQFLDANADGMQGYLTYESGGSPELYLNANKPVDLLTGVNNGIGASTTITYDSDFHYQNTYMPYFMSVVKSTTTTINGQSYTTNYNYAGGLWDKAYREFDGFQTVTVTDANGNYVTSTYWQDHWGKGHPLEQDTYDVNGNLYTKSVNTWGSQTIATNSNYTVGGAAQTSKFLYISRTDNYLYDGNNLATPKRTAQETTYGENPQYGDPTQVINDGQVDPTAGTSIDPNKTITNTTYVNNTANWIVGLPAQTTTLDINNNVLGKTSFYYDNDTTGSAAPSLGHLTAKVNWLGSTTQADPKTTYTYDAYGNLATTTDPNLNTTTITYDNTVHMLPEKTTNALKQGISMTYYGIDGVALNNGAGLQGLWGQERSKTDANNQTAYTTYDVFGRPVESISPLDTVALPTEEKAYNIQSTYIEVTDTARQSSGSSSTISTTSFYDGLGRLIETKSLGPTAGQYIASGQAIYDDRGLPITKYLPYFTSNNLNTMDSINTSDPSSQATYDPMGRILTQTNPDGTHSSIAYSQWQTTTTDENGHMQQSFVDAFGRLVQKQEYMGADGRSPNYPAAAYALYATTNYAYNPQGNLVSVTDAHNNVTTITYDNLGRKTAMNDPDMGKWQYGYDGNGNLTSQQDAKGQVISFKYDALNRLFNKTDATALQAATFNVNYTFDSLNQSYGIGRLGSVAYNGGAASFVYDQLGREIASNKTIGAGNYNVTRQYDALNRLQQLQYPDGSQVKYVYNQAGQVSGVADAAAVVNGAIVKTALESKPSNDRLAWLDKALGVNNAYAQTASSPVVAITSPIYNSNIKAGSNLTITASASETNGTISSVSFALTNLYNATSTVLGKSTTPPYSYTITNIASGPYTLTATATDANGVSTISSQIYITVTPGPLVCAITSPANNSTFTAGSNLTIDASASETNGSVYYLAFVLSNSNGQGSTMLGVSTAVPYSYPLTNLTAGTYNLFVRAYDNSGVSTLSNPVAITVTAPVAPTITTQPTSKTVTAPATAAFTVVATGTPAPTYQWQQEASGATSYTAISGATSASYTTPATTTANSGTKYECVVTNSVNSIISTTAILTVNPATAAPTITKQPTSLTVTAPATATFTVTATGTPAPTYQWDSEASGAAAYTAISGATSASYTTAATTIANSGTKYECVVTNSVNSIISTTAILTVNPATAAPTITKQPTSLTVTAPATAMFTVTATGTPTPTYQWQSEASGATAYTAISGATSAAYTTAATTTANNGTKYECVVANSVNNVISTAATLTVSPTSSAPVITKQPTSLVVTAPATATFTVTATGTPTPTYQWESEASGATAYTAISGATGASYTTAATTIANSGTKYECVVTNSVNSAISTVATLTVNPALAAPVLTKQPTSLTVIAPATATFTVTVTGTPTPTYQWESEASGATAYTAISGATGASYTTAATTIANSGTKYECVVTNSVNSVISTAATLAVNEAVPTVSLSANSASYAAPASVTLTATVSQVGGTISSVSFYNGSTLLGSVTSSPYTYTWSNVAAGSYSLTAKASNNNGGTTVSNAVNISVVAPNVYVQNISYNANGQITQIQYGNGTTTAYTYNPLNFRLTRIYTTNAQNVIMQDLNYTYDSVGQVLSIKDNVNTATQTFAYDALNRLTNAQDSKTYGTKVYAYDSIGNITQKDGLTYTYAGANSRTNGTAAGPHAVTSLSDGTVFKYDLNGNMVSLQKGSNLTQYAYDSQNRLQTVTVGGLTAATYVYDGDGGRTEKTVVRRDLALYNDNVNATLFGSVTNPLPATAANPITDTTIDVGNVWETESGVSRSTKFIYLGSTRVSEVSSNGTVMYYHTDHLGGTNVLTDQTGSVREETEYDPYGQVVVHEKYGNNFATAWYYFTGKPLDDETGLIFLGSRYYNPMLGRFITPDNVVQAAASNPQTLNRYSYCGNNPVNATDPTGHSWWKKFWHSFVGAFVGALVTFFTGGLGAPIAFALGGMVGGAITGGLNGGLQGALMGGLIGGVLGGAGGYGYQLSQAAGTSFVGNAIMGGLAAGGIGYTAATGNWASFAGGLAGFGASQVAVGVGAALGEHLSVEGNLQTASKYDVMGILQNQDKIALDALHASNSDTAFFYQNSNGFIADIVRAGMAKIFGVSQAASDLNGYIADGISSGVLTSVDAHSEGTIMLADALEHSSSSFNETTFSFNGPAVLQTTAQEAVSHVDGIMLPYTVNGYDPIGVFTTMNPFRMVIYAGAGILTGARYHAATAYPNMGINAGEGVGG